MQEFFPISEIKVVEEVRNNSTTDIHKELEDIVFKTNGVVKDCQIVTLKSNEYRQSPDYISEYIRDRISRDDEGRILSNNIGMVPIQYREVVEVQLRAVLEIPMSGVYRTPWTEPMVFNSEDYIKTVNNQNVMLISQVLSLI